MFILGNKGLVWVLGIPPFFFLDFFFLVAGIYFNSIPKIPSKLYLFVGRGRAGGVRGWRCRYPESCTYFSSSLQF